MPDNHVHLHLPSGPGTITIKIDGTGVIEVTSQSMATTGVLTTEDAGDTETPTQPVGIEAMLQRFEAYDHVSGAREIYEATAQRGWEANLPGGATDGTTSAPYIRLSFKGTAFRVTLYMNSAAVYASGNKERPVLAAVPGAEIRTTEVHVNHTPSRDGSVANALTVIDRLEHFANGGTVPLETY